MQKDQWFDTPVLGAASWEEIQAVLQEVEPEARDSTRYNYLILGVRLFAD